MEIILKQDVDNLGNKNDIVEVRPGYANNYLIPQGMAKAATAAAKKMLAEELKQQAHKEAKFVADAEAVIAKLAETTLKLTVKASEGGKIFGSITSAHVADALTAAGFNFDKKLVTVPTVKEIGAYEATVKVYRKLTGNVKFEVAVEE